MSFIDSTWLVVHVLSGFVALVAGPAAMFSRKGGMLHRRSGATFVAAMGAVGATGMLLAILRPNFFLFAIALITLALTAHGFCAALLMARRRRPRARLLAQHVVSMLSAYIATFTAFAITNFTFLPAIANWLVPSVMGTVAIRATLAHYRRWPPTDSAAAEASAAESREP